jgi:hypothetical protein
MVWQELGAFSYTGKTEDKEDDGGLQRGMMARGSNRRVIYNRFHNIYEALARTLDDVAQDQVGKNKSPNNNI